MTRRGVRSANDQSESTAVTLGLFLALFSALAGPAVVLTMLVHRRRRLRSSRRSPLTADLLRPPAHSVRLRFEAVSENVDEHALILVIAPVVLYAAYVTALVLDPHRSAPSPVLFVVVTVALAIGRASSCDDSRFGSTAFEWASTPRWRSVRNSTSSCVRELTYFTMYQRTLSTLITLSFAKRACLPLKRRGAPNLRRAAVERMVAWLGWRSPPVPDWSESSPLEQTRRQAAWVARWLTAATGATVSAQPVLALPGWWIDQTGTSDVRVINGKRPQHLLSCSRGGRLSAEMVQRIAYQIEQKCRDVKPEFQRLRAGGHTD